MIAADVTDSRLIDPRLCQEIYNFLIVGNRPFMGHISAGELNVIE